MKENKTRNYQIDNLRAMAILLVVFGHSIAIYTAGWDKYHSINSVPVLNAIGILINLFHMPLFFAIAGFLFVFTLSKRKAVTIIADKAKRLLIPYLIFAFLWVLPIRLILRYPGYSNLSLFEIITKCLLYGSDNGHLWFILALFWCFFLNCVFYKLMNRITGFFKISINEEVKVFLIFLISFFMFVSRIIVKVPYFDDAFHFFFWFMAGEVIRLKYDLFDKLKIFHIIAAGIICVALTVLHLKLDGSILLLQLIVVALWLFLFFSIMTHKEKKPLMFLSSVSYGLYLFHSPMLYITFTYLPDIHPFLFVTINFWGFGSLAVLLAWLVKHSRLKFAIGE